MTNYTTPSLSVRKSVVKQTPKPGLPWWEVVVAVCIAMIGALMLYNLRF